MCSSCLPLIVLLDQLVMAGNDRGAVVHLVDVKAESSPHAAVVALGVTNRPVNGVDADMIYDFYAQSAILVVAQSIQA